MENYAAEEALKGRSLLLHASPFMNLYPVPDNGRMERPKLVVGK